MAITRKSYGHFVAIGEAENPTSQLTHSSPRLKILHCYERYVPPYPELRIHRSHWISLDAVKSLNRSGNKWTVDLNNGRRLPVSRELAPELRDALDRAGAQRKRHAGGAQDLSGHPRWWAHCKGYPREQPLPVVRPNDANGTFVTHTDSSPTVRFCNCSENPEWRAASQQRQSPVNGRNGPALQRLTI